MAFVSGEMINSFQFNYYLLRLLVIFVSYLRNCEVSIGLLQRCLIYDTLAKGQLISECLFGVFNVPKDQRKNLMNFCPRI